MKFWVILAGLVVATALAGHFSGRWRGEREVLAERQREVDALVAKQRAIGESIARLVRDSEEIVVVTLVNGNPRETRQVFRDDAWRAKLVGLLVEAPYHSAPHGLWITMQSLEFRAKGEVRLRCMCLGEVLRAYGAGINHAGGSTSGGEFFVGDAVTRELGAWLHARVDASGALKTQ